MMQKAGINETLMNKEELDALKEQAGQAGRGLLVVG